MSFSTDKQTLDDLNIFDRHGADSIFNIYNRCATRGGAAVMEEMFRYPLSNTEAINRRSSIIAYFASNPIDFPFQHAHVDAVEGYLANTDERTKLVTEDNSLGKKLSNILTMDVTTMQIHKGITAMAELVKCMNKFIGTLQIKEADNYIPELKQIEALLLIPVFANLLETSAKINPAMMVKLDELLRFRNRETINKLLGYISQLDVYISTGRVARERKFSFAVALAKGQRIAEIAGFYHPLVEHAVPNSIRITPERNVIFLTGANMAGKSTLMKSLSISLYLAHMGFPIAAESMRFSVLDGLYTTINLPDNLGMGASHFYSEVLRVKKIATELRVKNLFVLFDELFRGTNVKDAAEATIAVAEAFAQKKHSIFILSTHIIEAGAELMKRCGNIRFVYMPTRMQANKPVYAYTLEEGITEDRHGMIIINNEKILEILESGKKEYNEY